MTDFLEEKKKEIHARLAELRPLVDEYHRLEEAEAALSGVVTTSGSSARVVASPPAVPAPGKKRRGRPVGSKKKTAAKPEIKITKTKAAKSSNGAGRRGRPKGSGTRAVEALELVKSRPGISIPELADAMGIKQNYLYRVMPTLSKEKLIAKKGKGWVARVS